MLCFQSHHYIAYFTENGFYMQNLLAVIPKPFVLSEKQFLKVDSLAFPITVKGWM